MWGGVHEDQTMVVVMRKEGCVSETEFLNEKQDEKTNEKWKVPKKHLSEVFFSFILFLSTFLSLF